MGDLLSGGLKAILGFLPPSPFAMLDKLAAGSFIMKILAFVNWFIPVYSWIGIVEGWLAAVAVYYVYQVVLRWLNAIE